MPRLSRPQGAAPQIPASVSDLDPEQLAGLIAGDLSALEHVYERFGDQVFRTALHMLGQVADAEDAAQEVFLRLFAKAGLYSGRASFSSWVRRMTVNLCLNRIAARRSGPGPPTELDEAYLPPASDPAPGDGLSCREEFARLHDHMRCLSADQRTVIVLREIEGLTYAEIAQALEIPEGTVMSRLSRGREKLLSRIEGQEQGGKAGRVGTVQGMEAPAGESGPDPGRDRPGGFDGDQGGLRAAGELR